MQPSESVEDALSENPSTTLRNSLSLGTTAFFRSGWQTLAERFEEELYAIVAAKIDDT